MQQHRYSVYQENLVIEEADPKLVDIEASVYKLNETTNGLNLSLKFKIDLPENTMVSYNLVYCRVVPPQIDQ